MMKGQDDEEGQHCLNFTSRAVARVKLVLFKSYTTDEKGRDQYVEKVHFKRLSKIVVSIQLSI